MQPSLRLRSHGSINRATAPDRATQTSALLTAAVLAALGVPAGAQHQFLDATATRMPAITDNTRSVALGDVDGDGNLDLVVGNDQRQNRLYLNNGTGAFTDVTTTRMPAVVEPTTSVAFGDVDSDGDLDLVVGNGSFVYGRQSRLYLNNGPTNPGVFTDVTATRMPVIIDLTNSVALGDVDSDGDLDLVMGNGGRNVTGQQNRLYVNNAGTFADVTVGRMPVSTDRTTSVALGDVDGDGDLDLVLGNYFQQNRLYLNDGAGRFTDGTASRMPIAALLTTSLALGDVDGDGDVDLVVGDVMRQVHLYLNDGAGTFTDVTASRMPLAIASVGDTRALALGDVDSDGDLDLVVGNWGQQNRLYLNDGTGTFTDVTASRMTVDSDQALVVALGDVDADGDLDLVVGNWNQQNRLYLNLLRQLDAPQPPTIGQPYTLDAYARYGPPSLFDVALPYLSTTRVSLPVPGLGIVGIDPMVPMPPVLIPQPAGVASTTFNLPNLPGAVGIPLYAQALIVSWPLQARLTNVTVGVVQ